MDWKRTEEVWIGPTVEAAVNAVETVNDELPPKIPLATLLKVNSNDAREFLCGWGAAIINVSVTYPINKIIFRQVSRMGILYSRLFIKTIVDLRSQ